jgi:hypothetical protein
MPCLHSPGCWNRGLCSGSGSGSPQAVPCLLHRHRQKLLQGWWLICSPLHRPEPAPPRSACVTWPGPPVGAGRSNSHHFDSADCAINGDLLPTWCRWTTSSRGGASPETAECLWQVPTSISGGSCCCVQSGTPMDSWGLQGSPWHQRTRLLTAHGLGCLRASSTACVQLPWSMAVVFRE